MIFLIVTIIVVILIYIIKVYNSFIQLRNNVEKSLSGIDVQLERRANLLPNLVETVKKYSQYENQILKDLTQVRVDLNSSVLKERMNGSDDLNKIFQMIVESYPQLKASDNFLVLQEEIANTEDMIQASRRLYNSDVNNYNNGIQTFPKNIIANITGFTRNEFYSLGK